MFGEGKFDWLGRKNWIIRQFISVRYAVLVIWTGKQPENVKNGVRRQELVLSK